MDKFISYIIDEVNKHRTQYNKQQQQKQKQSKTNNNNVFFEVIPCCKIADNIYDYYVSGRYFNEVLSIVSALKWDEIYHGFHYIYNHNSVNLLVAPEGKSSAYITNVLTDSFWLYDK